MTPIEKATIIHYHRHRIESYPNEPPETLGWKDDESQIRRFEALSSVGDLKDCVVLDVGCGYGCLKTYLNHNFSDFTYSVPGVQGKQGCLNERQVYLKYIGEAA